LDLSFCLCGDFDVEEWGQGGGWSNPPVPCPNHPLVTSLHEKGEGVVGTEWIGGGSRRRRQGVEDLLKRVIPPPFLNVARMESWTSRHAAM